jgi:hypothetical protein
MALDINKNLLYCLYPCADWHEVVLIIFEEVC